MGLGPGARVLEIGCGTGQATVPLAERGCELVASGHFGPARFHRYERDLTYPINEYLEVLMTYSGHLALPPPARRGLLDCIARLIDQHGGSITKRYLTELRYAYRIA